MRELRMERTAGLGREAQVWADGHLLVVCDGVSEPDCRCSPGPLEQVRFGYMTEESFTWEQAIGGNPARRRKLEHVRRWSYVGFGRVMSVAPVVIDFGLLQMEDANWTTDESLTGKFVRVAIDRLEVLPEPVADWPEGV